MSLKQSLLCCIFGSILGSSVTGYLATFGAATGLRQMSISRYSFGWWPNKLVALLNVIQQIGWAAVGCITGGDCFKCGCLASFVSASWGRDYCSYFFLF